ncbi:MAG: LuxR C-terminal-related transcriptional regulator [Solirubrobacteraceae bacterium]
MSGPVATQLRERIAVAVARGQAVLDQVDGPGPGAGSSDGDRGELRQLAERLGEMLGGDYGGAVREQEAALERVRRRYDGRFEALDTVRQAMDALRTVTSPAALLGAAPAALCNATRLRRALLSLTASGQMVAESAHFAENPDGAATALAALRQTPIRLEHPLIETELLRRRRATIVDDAQVHPRVDRRLVAVMGWTSYAAAPLVVGPHLIGMLHADRGPGERLDVLDRDVLWEFTSLLAQAYESATLHRALRHEREQMREFLDWVGARSGELTDAPIRLATIQRPSRPATATPIATPATVARDDRVVFEGLVTRRELDVLRLLADGHSNRAIAEALVISPGTVKFHVNSILRKLHVANRAEAVARYLRLLGMRAP